MKATATSERDPCLPPVGEVRTGILRHAGALDLAIARKASILLRLRKGFSAGNMWVTATAQDDDTGMAACKVTGIDIRSGGTGHSQVQ